VANFCVADGFFERDASHLLSALSTHPSVASEKALASSDENSVQGRQQKRADAQQRHN
jgi:hypothetical protein